MHNPSYLSFLEPILTPARLQHSLGVAGVMRELATVYQLDRAQAETTGLLHDAAKDLSPAQANEIVRRHGIGFDTPCDQDYVLYLHGPVGACFIADQLGIDDPLVLESIRIHTFYGDPATFTPPAPERERLVWCLRFSDLLEPYRNWSQVPWLRDRIESFRQIVYNGELAQAGWLQCTWLVEWFTATEKPVHPNMLIARDSLQDLFLRQPSRG